MENRIFKTLLIAGACSLAATAQAENRAKAWVVSGMAGVYSFDQDRGVSFVEDDPKAGPTGTIAIGYNITNKFGVETALSFFSLEGDDGRIDYDGQQYRLDALYHFTPEEKITPYVIGGVGHQVINGTPWGDAAESILNAGLGAKAFISENVALRADARIVSSSDYDYTEAMYNFGLAYMIGGEPATPPDADSDGVEDAMDKCADTAAGIQVDAEGCALDTDKDGVPNQNDSCPTTPAGSEVDTKGCPVDSDSDGIADADDKCPNTPANAKVTASGCPVDTDGDGIADYADKCLDTPEGAEIDESGCRVQLSETVELSMQIEFSSGSNALQPVHFDEIKRVAEFMVKYPDSAIIIEGHTDSTGKRSYNLSLSQKRANAVRDRLVAFHAIDGKRITAVGYGPDRPIADNRSREGRQQNRRVIAVVKAVVQK